MSQTALLGFPRVGPDRELKKALEAYWAGKSSEDELQAVARELRAANLRGAVAAGIDVVPSNDFSLYDHILDTTVMVGAIPPRFSGSGLQRYFAMARGTSEVKPLEMTKWLDTNYHYLVAELAPDTTFTLDASKPLSEWHVARELGITTRPVIVGPVSFLLLAKSHAGVSTLTLLDRLLPLYEELLGTLRSAGVESVQLDEPCLVLDRSEDEMLAMERAWKRMDAAAHGLSLTLATYFGGLGQWLDRVLHLPAAEFHLDVVRGAEQLATAAAALPATARLSLGVIDGRNVWTTDLDRVLAMVEPVIHQLGADRVRLAPSCSLLHVPYDASREQRWDEELHSWIAFGREKMLELRTLKAALGAADREELLAANRAAMASRRASARVRNPDVKARLESLKASDYQRASAFPTRARRQAERLRLPDLPTTTIGSFPQTKEIREMRLKVRKRTITTEEYENFLKDEIRSVIRKQEDLGFDVLVHGEAERNDMVEYFAEFLDGYTMSTHGWVQSYGSRCVKPPIAFGDVSRREVMTVRWWRHSQSCTTRPMKGMLTGPVTILQWSFVRDDQPREITCRQIALAVRDETLDLEKAGAQVIQIDEAALREGLPLRSSDQDSYVRWAVDCFRLAGNGVSDSTQVHSHMCYSEFNQMIEHIARLDADVISIEASRSQMDLLDAFVDYEYPNAVGPGVYDIHSPRVPSVDEIDRLIALALERIPRERLWINPDCGLKTRGWAEVMPSLENLVTATRKRRASVAADA